MIPCQSIISSERRNAMRKTVAQIMEGIDGVLRAKLVAPNTVEYWKKDEYDTPERIIRFHHTDILTFHPSGNVTVRMRGFDTASTRCRINEFGESVGISCYKKRGSTMIGWGGSESYAPMYCSITIGPCKEPEDMPER